MKLSDDTITQNRLIWRPAGGSVWASWIAAPAVPAPTLASVTRSTDPCSRGLLEDQRQDRDDDREDAEALGERGAEDELGPDLRRRVRIAADRARREPGQDADADARADHAESGETCAERSESGDVHGFRL